MGFSIIPRIILNGEGEKALVLSCGGSVAETGYCYCNVDHIGISSKGCHPVLM